MAAWLFALALLASVVPSHTMVQAGAHPRVVLITLDGVRWQDVFNGTDPHRGKHILPDQLMPNLYKYFVGHGVVFGKTSPMTASGPNFISLPGYLEITRGYQSNDCTTNDCNPIIDRSILQFFMKPAVFSSWVGVGKTLPFHYSGYSDIGKPYYRWDEHTEDAAIQYLCNHHDNDFVWISLGDTDELAHKNDYAGYITALHNADAFIGALIDDSSAQYSTWIITTDHGRNANFSDHDRNRQGQRVWAAMYGRGVPELGFVRTNMPVSLSDIYNTVWGLEFNIRMYNSLLGKVVMQ
jgi:hypothetical protein